MYILGSATGAQPAQLVQWEKAHFKEPALHNAVNTGNANAVKLLWNAGIADIDITDTHGWTSLHKAAHLLHPDIVGTLLKLGADFSIIVPTTDPSCPGKTALELAESHQTLTEEEKDRRQRVIELLEDEEK